MQRNKPANPTKTATVHTIVKSQRGWLRIADVLAVPRAAGRLVIPLLASQLVIPGTSVVEAGRWILAMAGAAGVSAGATQLNSGVTLRAERFIASQLARVLNHHVAQVEDPRWDTTYRAEVLRKNDIPAISDYFGNFRRLLTSDLFQVGGTMCLPVLYAIATGIGSFAGSFTTIATTVAPNLAGIAVAYRRLRKGNRLVDEERQAIEKDYHNFDLITRGRRLTQSYDAGEKSADSSSDASDVVEAVAHRRNRWLLRTSSLSYAFSLAGFASLAGLATFSNAVTIPELVIGITTNVTLMPLINSLPENLFHRSEAKQRINSFDAALADPGKDSRRGYRELEIRDADFVINFEDVSFRHPSGLVGEGAAESRQFSSLVNLNATLDARDGATALVSLSGAGKSTILDLLEGAWLPDSGRITLQWLDTGEVIDLAEVSRKARAQLFVRCYQDARTRGSFREALQLADPNAGADKMSKQLRDFGLADALWRAGGLDAAADLSGGQRMRLALAVAALRGDAIRQKYRLTRAPMLLADEPTTGLGIEGREIFGWIHSGQLRNTFRSVTLATHDVDELVRHAVPTIVFGPETLTRENWDVLNPSWEFRRRRTNITALEKVRDPRGVDLLTSYFGALVGEFCDSTGLPIDRLYAMAPPLTGASKKGLAEHSNGAIQVFRLTHGINIVGRRLSGDRAGLWHGDAFPLEEVIDIAERVRIPNSGDLSKLLKETDARFVVIPVDPLTAEEFAAALPPISGNAPGGNEVAASQEPYPSRKIELG